MRKNIGSTKSSTLSKGKVPVRGRPTSLSGSPTATSDVSGNGKALIATRNLFLDGIMEYLNWLKKSSRPGDVVVLLSLQVASRDSKWTRLLLTHSTRRDSILQLKQTGLFNSRMGWIGFAFPRRRQTTPFEFLKRTRLNMSAIQVRLSPPKFLSKPFINSCLLLLPKQDLTEKIFLTAHNS